MYSLQQQTNTTKKKTVLIISAIAIFAIGIGASIFALYHRQVAEEGSKASQSNITGKMIKWYPIEIKIEGPASSEAAVSPNPFLDFRLDVTFTSPTSKRYIVPGFYDGDGNGGPNGKIWKARFTPSETGTWTYTVAFRQGAHIATSDPEVNTGMPINPPDGQRGTFTINAGTANEPGFYKYGLLEYVNGYYLKFRDGPYFIKGGTNSPENFLGYAGFDNTQDLGGTIPNFLHTYTLHESDFTTGDPLFTNSQGKNSKAIIGSLNYLSTKNVNSIYFLPMNLGGDGQDTHPFITPTDKTHYSVKKLNQWNQVFEHATAKGIMLEFVLAESEVDNTKWLDNGTLGPERRLFYRELIARFGHNLAIKWILSEENTHSTGELTEFAKYIKVIDPYDHPLGVHTLPNEFRDYEQLKGNSNFDITSIQYDIPRANEIVETWRQNSKNANRKWVIDMDENAPANEGLTDTNADLLRKKTLYPILFSGGNIEWNFGLHDLPLGGDLNAENFRTREKMWDYTWYARKFMQENLPFWEMEPTDNLVQGENETSGSAQVFAKEGSIYAIYFPSSNPNGEKTNGTIDLTRAPGKTLTIKWYNPRTGSFEGTDTTLTGGTTVTIPASPSAYGEDWVLLLSDLSFAPISTFLPTQTPILNATVTQISTNSGATIPASTATPTPHSDDCIKNIVYTCAATTTGDFVVSWDTEKDNEYAIKLDHMPEITDQCTRTNDTTVGWYCNTEVEEDSICKEGLTCNDTRIEATTSPLKIKKINGQYDLRIESLTNACNSDPIRLTCGKDSIVTSCGKADSNDDGKLNILDFANFRGSYNKDCNITPTLTGCGPNDSNLDKAIDLKDFADWIKRYKVSDCEQIEETFY